MSGKFEFAHMPTALVMEVIRLLLENQPFFKGKIGG